MAFCPYCGTKMQDSEQTCAHCGASLFPTCAPNDPKMARGLAISAMVLGIVSVAAVPLGLPAVIFGDLAKRRRIKALDMGARGAKLKTARVCGIVGFTFGLIVTVTLLIYAAILLTAILLHRMVR